MQLNITFLQTSEVNMFVLTEENMIKFSSLLQHSMRKGLLLEFSDRNGGKKRNIQVFLIEEVFTNPQKKKRILSKHV